MIYFEEANKELKLDKNKVYEIISCHDMIESLSGDIANHDHVS